MKEGCVKIQKGCKVTLLHIRITRGNNTKTKYLANKEETVKWANNSNNSGINNKNIWRNEYKKKSKILSSSPKNKPGVFTARGEKISFPEV